MALNIKNREVEELVAEVAELAGESKTEAVRKALLDRRQRLELAGTRKRRHELYFEHLERDVWPRIPPENLGRRPTQEEEDEILGYGPDGV